uniref:Uncharacterized protein n=1 Tax=Oryza glumipatula TaxID=40148 RepID=A0A0D9ZVX1_9ORYZ
MVTVAYRPPRASWAPAAHITHRRLTRLYHRLPYHNSRRRLPPPLPLDPAEGTPDPTVGAPAASPPTMAAATRHPPCAPQPPPLSRRAAANSEPPSAVAGRGGGRGLERES